MVSIIVAIAENLAIGKDNKLIYWLPDDLKRFKQLTTGNTIIMGRKTFESLPKGALPNRRNIVLSRTASQKDFPGAELFNTLEDALANVNGDAYIIGGASVYKEALKMADRLCLTEIHDTPKDADTFFPAINKEEWKEVFREDRMPDEKHSHAFSFVDLERIKSQNR